MSEVAPSVGTKSCTPLDPIEEEKLRAHCWVATTGGKRRGRLYGVVDLARIYIGEDENIMKHTQLSCSQPQHIEEINRLKTSLHLLQSKFETFINVFIPYLPQDAAQTS